MFNRYEMRFMREDGRVLRGPIFGKGDYAKMQNVIDQLESMSIFQMKMGSHRIVVPQESLSRGHAEIRRVGLIYSLIRAWRCR